MELRIKDTKYDKEQLVFSLEKDKDGWINLNVTYGDGKTLSLLGVTDKGQLVRYHLYDEIEGIVQDEDDKIEMYRV